jgi:hypothetical protein
MDENVVCTSETKSESIFGVCFLVLIKWHKDVNGNCEGGNKAITITWIHTLPATRNKYQLEFLVLLDEWNVMLCCSASIYATRKILFYGTRD